MSTNIIKHCALWIVFSFFYLSGLEMALVLAIDGQPEPTLTSTLGYTFLFNLLVGHLISKYEKLSPVFSAIVISLCGIVGFGYIFSNTLTGYSQELLAGLVVCLPVATYLVLQIKQWQAQKLG
ncbi:hypothetical protein [Pseudoalteromonas aurantia]|uniref:Uncharacterized protein n=1 Tax=Pseudoalteromonas aurantia TaxID=43654 RepID=A0A5S3VEH7_9GAMM|nr:hypothetical protein [Pseudoalteromonas aurantia]TMO56567.1 hypothetical protein CWC18_19270 [Pseudoalteromonas aurantia]TMO70586.1 hypothetical protein CWC19_00540 [Pseudoalteromonas aurantia]TMO73511.1 hypothetical protein CWC20_12980 [Pseudoalteromonas aurantia]